MTTETDIRKLLNEFKRKYQLKGALVYDKELGIRYYNFEIHIKPNINNILKTLKLIRELENTYD